MAAVLATAATLLLSPSPATARLAESLTGGKVHVVLDKRLFEALRGEGVDLVGTGGTKVAGRTVTMPLREAFLEYGGGTGYAIPSGGLRLRGEGGSVDLTELVLNTAKRRFNARIDGRSTVLAVPAGLDGAPTRYGLEVAVKRLGLTGAGARALNRALGLSRVFVAGSPLGRALVGGETPTVPIALSKLELGFDESFRQKLAALGVTASASGSATQIGTVPLAFSFPDAKGEANRHRSQGGIVSRTGSVHLVQGTFPVQREATIALSLSFESTVVGSVRETWPTSSSGAPLGDLNFATVTGLDQASGAIEAPPTPVPLSPAGADQLNEAFVPSQPPRFFAGELVGTISFAGRLGN